MSNDLTIKLPDDPILKLILERLNSIDGRMTKFEANLAELDHKVDTRLYDTRPMWEAVTIQLQETTQKLDRIDRKMDRLIKDVFEVRTDMDKLSSRVDDLESKAS